MKIGNQGVHCLESVTGINEKVGFSLAPGDGTVLGHRRLKRADRGSANAHGSLVAPPRLIEGISHGGGNRVSLAVHMVLFNALSPHRLKGAPSHIKGKQK